MTLSSVFGTLAMIASLVIIVWGLPQQVYLNYKRKSCGGLSPQLVYSTAIIYLFWTLYGWTVPNWYLIIPDTPGLIICLILVYQLYCYGDRQKRAEFWQRLFAWVRPDCIVGNLAKLDICRLARFGPVYLILDLDNTLCLPGSEEIDAAVVEMLQTASVRGFIGGVVILSNTVLPNAKRQDRVARIAQKLGAQRVCAIWPYIKPSPIPFNRAMAKMPRANRSNTVVVGDQLFTDIWGARRAGLKSALVRPLGRDAPYGTWKRWAEALVFHLTQWR